MRMHSKAIRFIGSLLLILILIIITNIPLQILAAELPQNDSDRAIDVDIITLKENLTEGMLEIPEDVQRKTVLYQLIMEGVEQYVSETGIEDVFSCDFERNLLYGIFSGGSTESRMGSVCVSYKKCNRNRYEAGKL